MLQSLFYLKTALYVSGVTITHLQEHKTTVTTASGNRYTVTELNLLMKSTFVVNNVYSADNAICSIK
jgi:thiamine pyrophosphokinase